MKKYAFLLLCLLCSISIINAQYTVNGGITNSKGEPILFANIIEKGTTNGAVSDVNGIFSITVKDSLAILVVSSLGFESYELGEIYKSQNGNKRINIILKESQWLENEVVISASRKQRKRLKYSRRDVKVPGAVSSSALSRRSSVLAPPKSPNKNRKTDSPSKSRQSENPFKLVEQEAISTFSIDVDAASYSYIRAMLKRGIQPPRDAIRIEEMINYFNYDYPNPTGEHPFEMITEINQAPWNKKHQVLQIGLKGKDIPFYDLPASNLVFLIDVSGSMNDPNKLPLVKQSMILLIDKLRQTDRVAVVTYAGNVQTALPSTNGSDKSKIKTAIEKLNTGGGTAGGAAILEAYKIARDNFVEGGNNRIILATDGDFNIGVSSDVELVELIEKERESGVFLTVLGVGTGNYKDSKMQQLADKGNGNHAYLDNLKEAEKVLVKEFGGSLFTIAKDVKLQIEFNASKIQAYRLIGYENRMLAEADFKDDKKDAGELGSGHTVTALYEIIPVDVESEFLAESKIQNSSKTLNANSAETNGEQFATLKLRYKLPDGKTSQEVEQAISNSTSDFSKVSENFLWATAVAEFGLLLKSSKYKKDASYEHCLKLAKNAKGKDKEGYRAEMIDLIRAASEIGETLSAEAEE